MLQFHVCGHLASSVRTVPLPHQHLLTSCLCHVLIILTTVQLSISKKITVLWRLKWWLAFFFFSNKGFLNYAHGLFRQWAYFNWAVNRLQSRKIFMTHFIVMFTLLHLQYSEDTRTDLAVSLGSASMVGVTKKKTSQWLVHLRPFPSGLLSRLCMKSSVMVKLHLRWGYPYIGIRAGEFTFTVETHPVASLSRCYLRGPFLKNEMISFTVFTRCSWLQLIKKQIFVYSVNFLILIVN